MLSVVSAERQIVEPVWAFHPRRRGCAVEVYLWQRVQFAARLSQIERSVMEAAVEARGCWCSSSLPDSIARTLASAAAAHARDGVVGCLNHFQAPELALVRSFRLPDDGVRV